MIIFVKILHIFLENGLKKIKTTFKKYDSTSLEEYAFFSLEIVILLQSSEKPCSLYTKDTSQTYFAYFFFFLLNSLTGFFCKIAKLHEEVAAKVMIHSIHMHEFALQRY